MVNALRDAMVDGKSRELLMQKLAAYTFNHVRTEEAVMSSIRYPGLAYVRPDINDMITGLPVDCAM